MTRLRRALRLAPKAGRIIWHDIRANHLGRYWPLKPRTLNLLVNDICNSRCQMCRVWQQKRDVEITPQELTQILQDPLFAQLRYVGVSGGEPTLRPDLAQIFHVLAQKEPRLRGVGIITNAIRAQTVIERILASAEICRKAGVRFNVMVSLDGIGDVHDRIRGRQGNFESALRVLRFFRDRTDIPVSFGCTITKDNVWHVDELLDFAREEGLYGRFRVAEFIQRLYNEKQIEVIRNFTPLEAYHLGLFFAKLERTFESNPLYRRTYRNIRAMLMDGAPRAIGCPYQTQDVVLDCRGRLLYCSPRSPVLGSALTTSARRLYLDNLDIRRQIVTHHCPHCIHDYHAPATIREMKQQAAAHWWRRRLGVRSALARSRRLSPPHRTGANPNVRRALIIGWYGTETAGDKAILGEIVYRLQQKGATQITLASLYPYLSRWTIRELGYPEVRVIATHSPELLHEASLADETIMGGGPLMDLAALGAMLQAFVAAKRAGKRTRIAGCGVGPLHQPLYIEAVREMLRLADVIELRDSKSVEWARQQTGRTDIVNAGDPAMAFVHRWQGTHPRPPVLRTLNCYLREWTDEYKGTLSDDEFHAVKAQFEEQLGQLVATMSERLGLRPRLLAMHHFTIGGDDRDFNRHLARRYLSHLDPIVEMRPFSVSDILHSMQEATFCLTMRFHSTLFAHTLGVPFGAVDYTGGGKVSAFLSDHQALDRLLSMQQIASGQWRDRIADWEGHEHPAN